EDMIRHIPNGAGIAALLVLVAFPLVYGGANYDFIMHLWITAFFYAILASSWALLAGYGGQFSFGHMAFMALGAYGAGLLDNYVVIAGQPPGTCLGVGLFGNWLVFIAPTGVSKVESCLEVAQATWPAEATVSRFPLILGIFFGAVVGGGAGWLIGTL